MEVGESLNLPLVILPCPEHAFGMSSDGAPPPLPAESTATSPPPVFPLIEIGPKNRPQWWLTIFPTHLALVDAPGAQPYVILREQMMKSAVFMEGMRVLSLKEPRKVNLKLTPAGAKALADWIGDSFLAFFYMNRRYKMLLPWAVLWVSASLTSLVPTGSGIRPNFDAVALILGLVPLGAWAMMKWRPHPVLFLVDGIWFACVAIRFSLHVVQFDRNKAWFMLVPLMVVAAVTGFKHFIRFRNTSITPVKL